MSNDPPILAMNVPIGNRPEKGDKVFRLAKTNLRIAPGGARRIENVARWRHDCGARK